MLNVSRLNVLNCVTHSNGEPAFIHCTIFGGHTNLMVFHFVDQFLKSSSEGIKLREIPQTRYKHVYFTFVYLLNLKSKCK